MPREKDFEGTFKALKKILEPYQAKLVVASDTDAGYSLETNHVMKNKHRLYFGGIKQGKSYVSFYLMPVYACPEIRQQVSPELKKRMQGKSCFNFSAIDEELFKELAKLTKLGFKRFTDKEFYSQF